MIFELAQDLIIPKSLREQLGADYYSKEHFGLSYMRTFQNHLEKILEMEIVIVRKSDNKNIRTITKARFDSTGRQGEWINQEAVITYQDRYTLLTAQANKHEEQINLSTGEQKEDYQVQLTEVESQLSTLTIVDKEYTRIDKYDEVVEYFDSKGILTEAGLTWGLSLEILGSTIQSIIQISK